MRTQASIEFLLIASAIAVMSLSAVSLYGRSLFNQTKGLALMSDSFQEGTFVSLPGHGYGSAESYSVKIENRDESMAYTLTAPTSVVNLTAISHCTSHDFYGKILDVNGQCGTRDAWDYVADYGKCPSTAAYCEFRSDTGYSTLSTEPARTYRYRFTLLLYSGIGVMQADLSDGESSSPILLGNATVGHAQVTIAGSGEPLQSTSLLCSSSVCSLLNQTAYDPYSQWKNAAYSILSYYNSTCTDSATQSRIAQTVSSFIGASKALRSSANTPAPCRIDNSDYICGAAQPFYYTLQVNLSSGFSSGDQTLYYLGSIIDVHGE